MARVTTEVIAQDSDAQLRDQALALLQKTTDSYPTWIRKGKPATSNWAKAFALLARIGQPAPNPKPTPTGANPVPPPDSGVYFGANERRLLDAAERRVRELTTTLRDLLAWAERYRAGDPTLDPEEWYVESEHARCVLGEQSQGQGQDE